MTIPFLTTVIGSMPKPAWLYEQVAFNAKDQDHHGSGADWGFAGELLRQAQDDAVRATIHSQERLGIDIISDGEQRRKSYLTYITMHLAGFDYDTLAEKWIRDKIRRSVADLKRVRVIDGPIGSEDYEQYVQFVPTPDDILVVYAGSPDATGYRCAVILSELPKVASEAVTKVIRSS